MKVTILYDNDAWQEGLTADWGFACLIEAHGRKILFDTGASGAILLKNMSALGIDPRSIEELFVSHIHFDHSGGLSTILDINEDVTLHLPSSIQGVHHAREILYHDDPGPLHDHFYATGLLDGIEQSLVVDTDRGVAVVVGCSHPGVGNILKAAARFGVPCALIGGLHGFDDYASISDLESVCPTHCTGHVAEIQARFPDRYLRGGVGRVIEV